MGKKNNPSIERDREIKGEWWERYRLLLYLPAFLMSIAALIISIVQLLR